MSEINSKQAKRRIRWYDVLLLGVAFLLLVAIAIPNFVKARTTVSKNSCINNLREIQQGKEWIAKRHDLETGDILSSEQVTELMDYMEDQFPLCPADGFYEFNPVGEKPTCSTGQHINMHRLP